MDNPNKTVRIWIFTGLLSTFIGTLFVAFVFTTSPELKTNPIFKMLMFLMIANFFLGISFAVPLSPDTINDENALCQLTGMLVEFAKLSSLAWTMLFSKALHTMFTKKLQIELDFCQLSIACIVMPLIFSLIPLIFGWYGYSGTYCWIRASLPSTPQLLLTLIFLCVPVLVAFAYSFTILLQTMIHLKRNLGVGGFHRWEFYQLLLYPAVVLLSDFPPVVFKVFVAFGYNTLAFDVLVAALFYGQGLLDALVFSFNTKVSDCLKKKWRGLCKPKVIPLNLSSSLTEGSFDQSCNT
jgi:hypothetical protein